MIWSDIVFDPNVGMAERSCIVQLSDLLGTTLVPIGETRSEAIILMGDTGEVYLMGYVCSGVFLAGDTFGDAITSLLVGRQLSVIEFDETTDPNGLFRLREG